MAGKFVVALTLMSTVGYALAAQAGLDLTATGFIPNVGAEAGATLEYKGRGVLVSKGSANVVFKEDNSDEFYCDKKTAIGNAETLAKVVAIIEGSEPGAYCNLCSNCGDDNSGCSFREGDDEPKCRCNEGFMENSADHNKFGYDVECREMTWFDYAGSSEHKFKCWEGSFEEFDADGNVEQGKILKDGKKATCDPIGKYKKLGHNLYELNEAEGEVFPCCSRRGWCGNTANHCCEGCKDYSKDFDAANAAAMVAPP